MVIVIGCIFGLPFVWLVAWFHLCSLGPWMFQDHPAQCLVQDTNASSLKQQTLRVKLAVEAAMGGATSTSKHGYQPVKADTTKGRREVWVRRSDGTWSVGHVVGERDGSLLVTVEGGNTKWVRADDIGQCIRECDIDIYSSIDCNAPRSADPIVEGTFAMKIMLSGLLTWLTTPLLLYLSLFYSTCANGPAWWFYCVPFLTQACSLAVQFHIDQTIREAKFNATYLKELFSKPLAACLPPLRFSLSIMDHWVALTIFGVAHSFDLFSDAIQIGQVYMCDIEDPTFHEQYVESWKSIPPLMNLLSISSCARLSSSLDGYLLSGGS